MEATPSLHYVYVLVRRDVPGASQLVQACHAAHESGARFGAPPGCHLGALAGASWGARQEAILRAGAGGVPLSLFFEPDPPAGPGYTAACSTPLPEATGRRLFRRYSLWTP